MYRVIKLEIIFTQQTSSCPLSSPTGKRTCYSMFSSKKRCKRIWNQKGTHWLRITIIRRIAIRTQSTIAIRAALWRPAAAAEIGGIIELRTAWYEARDATYELWPRESTCHQTWRHHAPPTATPSGRRRKKKTARQYGCWDEQRVPGCSCSGHGWWVKKYTQSKNNLYRITRRFPVSHALNLYEK